MAGKKKIVSKAGKALGSTGSSKITKSLAGHVLSHQPKKKR
jgi:hypothetical protein